MAISVPCPHCGEDVAADAKFCRNCGSDAATGWNDEAEYGSTDLPEEFSDDDYDDWLAKEFPEEHGKLKPGVDWRALGIVILLVAFVLWMIR